MTILKKIKRTIYYPWIFCALIGLLQIIYLCYNNKAFGSLTQFSSRNFRRVGPRTWNVEIYCASSYEVRRLVIATRICTRRGRYSQRKRGSSPVDPESFISMTLALAGIRNFRRPRRYGKPDILTFTPTRITAPLLSARRKVDVIDGARTVGLPRLPGAVAHVPRVLWRRSPFCAALSSSLWDRSGNALL